MKHTISYFLHVFTYSIDRDLVSLSIRYTLYRPSFHVLMHTHEKAVEFVHVHVCVFLRQSYACL